MPTPELYETQSKVGTLKKKDSNRGPKDNGSRPGPMPDQPTIGVKRKSRA